MKLKAVILSLLLLGTFSAGAQKYDRGYETVPSKPFVKKGTFIMGGNARFSQHANDDYSFLVINNINSTGISAGGSLQMLCTFRDNMAVGIKADYDRSILDLTSADLAVAQIEMNAADCYQIQHKAGGYGVFRAYIPFGRSKRVAMFADLQLGGSFKQAIAYNAGGDYVVGTFNESYSLKLGVDPGLVAFLTDRFALQMNVGVFGVQYSWTNQIHNQVDNGNYDSTSAGFMVNLLALGIGISYYFL